MTVAEAEALGRDLALSARELGLEPDVVVGLANGAFLPAKTVADALGVPCEMVKVRRKGSRYKQRLSAIKERLHIPSELIMWGPFKAIWVVVQNRTSALETSEESFGFDVMGKRVLMVDDCVETGASFRHVAARLEAQGATEVRTAVYCWSRMPKVDDAVSRPDVHLHRTIQYYPWSNNSRHLGEFKSWLGEHRLELWK